MFFFRIFFVVWVNLFVFCVDRKQTFMFDWRGKKINLIWSSFSMGFFKCRELIFAPFDCFWILFFFSIPFCYNFKHLPSCVLEKVLTRWHISLQMFNMLLESYRITTVRWKEKMHNKFGRESKKIYTSFHIYYAIRFSIDCCSFVFHNALRKCNNFRKFKRIWQSQRSQNHFEK